MNYELYITNNENNLYFINKTKTKNKYIYNKLIYIGN